MPKSLFGRLLLTALLALSIALIFATLTIGHVLERFVIHSLDERLDAQITVVRRAIRSDGTLDMKRLVDVPPFDTPGSGWGWEVAAPGLIVRSRSLGSLDIVPAALPEPPYQQSRDDRETIRPFEDDHFGHRGRHGRMVRLSSENGDTQIFAVGPRSVVERPLHAAFPVLLLSLLLLGLWLALAILVQLRFGLRPLARLQMMLAEVRGGNRRYVDATEPTELLPLIGELNALIDSNEIALTQARGHVANLAHGLKTPLATLRLELADTGRDPDGRLTAQVERIDRHIRHHLGRARAASPTGTGRASVPLGPRVKDLCDALAHIHAERRILADIAVDRSLLVRCDPQDIDEMLGNLLDNGWRWARSSLRVSAKRAGPTIDVRVTDDGPGMAMTDLERALEPGARLDESGEGYGFGLSIARELAELYGGSLTLTNVPGSGLAATLILPAG